MMCFIFGIDIFCDDIGVGIVELLFGVGLMGGGVKVWVNCVWL